MVKRNKPFINYSNGSYIFLPDYVKVLRKIENKITSFLSNFGAHEIILPKIINSSEVHRLRKIHSRFEEELKDEQLAVYDQNGQIGFLAHWQCEPVYFYLNEIFNNIEGKDIKIIYDNSGFSYRDEKIEDIFNFHEFKRIEIVFLGTEFLVRKKLLYLQDFLLNLTKKLNPNLLSRPEESYGGKEEVTDIVLQVGSKEVEIFGSHIHFKTFIEGLNIDCKPTYITACCGISLSRITLAQILADSSSQNYLKTSFHEPTASYNMAGLTKRST